MKRSLQPARMLFAIGLVGLGVLAVIPPRLRVGQAVRSTVGAWAHGFLCLACAHAWLRPLGMLVRSTALWSVRIVVISRPLGSPSENLSLLDIPAAQEFVFQRVASGARKGDLSIVSKHPRVGEAANYLASPSSSPLTEDYGAVLLVPAVTPEHVVMILAGTTTFGTQGTVDFVSNADSVQQLLREIPASKDGIKPFEALLHVKIARGVPVESELVALHMR